MQHSFFTFAKPGTVLACLGFFIFGLSIGGLDNPGRASTEPPSEHKGVSVVGLGVVPEASMQAQIGLGGHILQLREITLAPGGAIARHDHKTRPGLVWTLEGSWTEGRPSGARDYPAGEMTAIVEDEETDHWFLNNGTEPVRVVVCDIVKAP